MAITFTSSPNPTIPFLGYGENKIKYNFTSNTATIVSCIVEVLINSVRVAAVSVQPNKGTTDEFTLAVNDILQTHLDFKLYTTALSTYDIDADGAKTFTVKVYEVTENVDGTLSTNYDPDDANNTNYDATIGILVIVPLFLFIESKISIPEVSSNFHQEINALGPGPAKNSFEKSKI